MLNTIAAILIFGIIILIHEFGHFLLAKINGVGVLEFSIGMGPRLFSFKRGETRYSIKCLPFGGSCMMEGEDAEAPGERSFFHKPAAARFAVIAAGPGFNFLLAFLAAMVIVFQVGHDNAVITDVMSGLPAQEAGLMKGDVITKIDHRTIYASRDISLYLNTHPGKAITVYYQRPVIQADGKTEIYEKKYVVIQPGYSEEYRSFMIGAIFQGYEKSKTPAAFIRNCIYEIQYVIRSTIDSFGMLLRKQIAADDAVAGPVKIVSMVGETVGSSRKAGLYTLLYVVANWILLLSTSLGFMNLMPIPALDGGRLVFLLVEMVRGKPLDPEKEGMVHTAGMALLMGLMVWVLCHDIIDLMH